MGFFVCPPPHASLINLAVYLQARGISVGTNGRESVTGLELSTDSESNDGRLVAGEEVLSVTLQHVVPVVLLLDLLESSLAKTDHGLLGGMEGRLSLVHKVQEVRGFDGGRADFGLQEKKKK